MRLLLVLSLLPALAFAAPSPVLQCRAKSGPLTAQVTVAENGEGTLSLGENGSQGRCGLRPALVEFDPRSKTPGFLVGLGLGKCELAPADAVASRFTSAFRLRGKWVKKNALELTLQWLSDEEPGVCAGTSAERRALEKALKAWQEKKRDR
jgi:hypothetical protein